MSNEEGMVYNLTHHSGLGNSDHISLKFNLNCYQQITKKDKMPNYFKADYKTIRVRIKHIDWTKELSDSYQNFMTILELSIEGCIPRYNVSGKKHNIYMNTNAIRKKNLKQKL